MAVNVSITCVNMVSRKSARMTLREHTHAKNSSTMLGFFVASIQMLRRYKMKKVKALGQEWELVKEVGQTATIKNETGTFSILASALEEVKAEKKAEKKPAKKAAKK